MTKDEKNEKSILYHARCIEKLIDKERGNHYYVRVYMASYDSNNNYVAVGEMEAKEGITGYIGICARGVYRGIRRQRILLEEEARITKKNKEDEKK